MPPLHDSLRALTLHTRPSLSSPRLLQSHCTQTRHASVLNDLRPIPTAIRTRKRLGRGPASGKGKTSGRGHKGQKQHGKVPAGFQGGQTPAEVTHGQRGAQSTVFKQDLRTLNLDRIQSWVDQGRLDAGRAITVRELQKSRCLHGYGEGVKLLARDAHALRTPIHIVVSRASAAAIAAVEQAGGSVQTRYYTKASIGRIMQGKTHPCLSRLSEGAYPDTPLSDSADLDPSQPSFEEASNTNAPDIFATPPSETQVQEGNFLLSSYPRPQTYRYRLPDAFARKDLEYYRDPAHRGYLAYQLQEGAGPSLFFKSPEVLKEEAAERKRAKRRAARGEGAREEKFDTGRIW
ncbi:MAG: hypothetical protein Q9159_001152 [Coniocarpon cinnabarinum]